MCYSGTRMAEYSKYLLTYLDIMGFRDLIRESTADPARVDAIIRILQLAKKHADTGLTLRDRTEVGETTNFSDLIIRARPLNNEAEILDWVNHELMTLSAIQSEITCRYGILLRGGMCINDLYMKDEMVFGPALVRAYELENELAVYPRIVIDPAIIALKGKGLLFNSYRMRGDDGVFFVNYLYGRYRETHKMIPGYEDKFELLRSHGKVVATKLKEGHKRGERVQQKFIWLALYHNSVLKEVISQAKPDQQPRFRSLGITDDEMENPI